MCVGVCVYNLPHSRFSQEIYIICPLTNDRKILITLSVEKRRPFMSLYVLYGHTYSKSMDQRGRVANLLVVS